MSLVALAAISGAAQFGASVFGAIGGIQEARQQQRAAERAARFARSDAREDYRFAAAEMDAEEQNMRMQAALTARQHDMQERELAEQAIEEQGMSLVSQAMRGTGGAGTQRSLRRGFNQFGRAQTGLGLERSSAFSQQRRASEMLQVARGRSDAGLRRVGRDTRQIEDDANRATGQAYDAGIAQIAFGAVQGATSAGMMMYRAGDLGGGGAGGVQGAGAGATTASNFTTDTNYFNSMGTHGLTMDPMQSIVSPNLSTSLRPRSNMVMNPNLNLMGQQPHFVFQ